MTHYANRTLIVSCTKDYKPAFSLVSAELGIGTLRMSLEIHKKYLQSIRTGVGRPQ